MKVKRNEVPRMKDTSQLERELKAILDNSFDRKEMVKEMLKIIKEDRESTLSEIGTLVLTKESRSYSRQVIYLGDMFKRIEK